MGENKTSQSKKKLLTPKQEAFCNALVSGLSQRKAYQKAYDAENMKERTIDRKATLMCSQYHIRARIDELYEQAAMEAKWSVKRLIAEFEEVKDKCMRSVPVLNKEGKPTGTTTFRDQGVLRALENIGKLLGYYKEKVEHSGEVNNPYAKLTEEELRRLADE